MKHEGDLETYIQDFDMLWYKAKIIEKQVLVLFFRRVGSGDKKFGENV